MLKNFIQRFFVIFILTISFCLPVWAAENNSNQAFIKSILESPLIVSNHDTDKNTLQDSVYELLRQAESSILIISFTLSDPEVIRLLNQKSSEGVDIQLFIDRDHLAGLKTLLHPPIHIYTREHGEGHLHHKILVVDNGYIWLASANFTKSGFVTSKNLAIGCFSPEIAIQLQQEALAIHLSSPRAHTSPFKCSYGDQLLELYVLPHHAPEDPHPIESAMNERGRQKLIGLIDKAKHHIKISVDVWTYKEASRAIIKALQRGVQVDVVTGSTMDEPIKMMIQQGAHVKQGRNLHHKFMLVDHKILLNGSPNWSMNAFSRSDESFIVLYNLTKRQLKELEGPLKVAGLPLSLHVNNKPILNGNVSAFENINDKIEKMNKTLTALNDEIHKIPTSQEQERLIAIAKRLSSDLVKCIPHINTAPLPGCCLYEGDNYLAHVVAIAEKQERVEKAIQHIKNASGVDQKVSAFFQKTLKKLQSGVNVPLPDYFHATSAGLRSIIASQCILQSRTGLTGPGTYISCNNEGDHGYGSYTFAIDEGCLVNSKALFRTGRHPVTNVFFSLWASVLMDIAVNEKNIAYIDTSAGDAVFVQALLKAQNLDIEVVDRKTSEEILRIFDITTKRRELPSFFWKKFNVYDYLPQNMYPRSLQGTYRSFVGG